MTVTLTELRDTLFAFSRMPSVAGGEALCAAALTEMLSPHFDSVTTDKAGNLLLCRRAPGSGPKKRLLVEVHFDEIGFIVTEICSGGFLRVAAVGGVDARVLPAARVNIYGKDGSVLPAVFSSTPPHLRRPEDAGKAPELSSLLLDTGLDAEHLSAVAPVGSLCGFASEPAEMLGTRVCGHGFDNKACCAAAVCGIAAAEREKLRCDIYLLLSCREEVGCVGGRLGAFAVMPDEAVVLDAEFGCMPGLPAHRTVKCGGGFSLTLGPVCDTRRTGKIAALSDRLGIPYQYIVYSGRTGTNCDTVNITAGGIPAVLLGVPLTGMHTPNESVDLCDLRAAASLLSAYVTEEDGIDA